jgi:hypothetical protein
MQDMLKRKSQDPKGVYLRPEYDGFTFLIHEKGNQKISG